jgi:hypothetical protein
MVVSPAKVFDVAVAADFNAVYRSDIASHGKNFSAGLGHPID